MKKWHSSNDKRPRPHAIAPREHYTYKYKTGSYKPKMAFSDEYSARAWVNSHYRDPENIAIYKCSICGLWHCSTHKKNDKTEKK